MGLRINVDLETNQGPTNQLYIRIDSWKVNMTVNEIKFTTTSWLNKKYGDNFLRKFYDEELKPAMGLVSSKLVYYPTIESEGEELNIDNLYTVPMFVEQEIIEPIYEEQNVSKEVPYVSFDEEGEEITLYRTITKKERVQVGEQTVVKKLVDYSIVNKLSDYCYDFLQKDLSRFFPKDNIEKLN